MLIITQSQKLQYELANVVRLFFPNEEIVAASALPEGEVGDAMVCCHEVCEGCYLTLTVELMLPNLPTRSQSAVLEDIPSLHRPLAYGKLLYAILSDYTGRTIDWGVLTGIRPVKLARQFRLEGHSPQEVEQQFISHYLTSPQKAALCRLTDQQQQSIIATALPRGYSLYISIPFCPSRCSYCSFVSHSTESSLQMIPAYLDKLCIELEYTAKLAHTKGMVLQSVYMGGGTPTILTAAQLRQVLQTVRQSYDLRHCTELTVEAGRPDTITPNKLEVLREMGVGRISVNCQTLNDQVLETVGRRHTVAQFMEAYRLVSQYGFDAVNVDLIAGLPGDTTDSFADSLQGVIDLHPENITVHALTVKRAARLAEEKQTILSPGSQSRSPVMQMVEHSQQQLAQSGYLPYYLYRQKGTVDSLENVGYALPGKACFYNVFIMDETHTILSVGGGGVTKLVAAQPAPGSGAHELPIQRIFNYKYPYEYLQRFDTMVAKKKAILDFTW